MSSRIEEQMSAQVVTGQRIFENKQSASFEQSLLKSKDQSMAALQKWQQDFASSIVKPSNCLGDFLPAGKLTSSEALEVYRRGYQVRLADALGQIYESVWGVLGDEEFFAAAKEFIEQERSDSYNINHYKITFVDFVGKRCQREYPFLRDLAALDWFYQELFHQPIEIGLSAQQLSETLQNIEVQRVQLVSSLKIMFSVYELGRIASSARTNRDSDVCRFESGKCTLMYKGSKGIELQDIDIQIGKAMQKLTQGRELTGALEDLDADQISGLFKLLAEGRLALTLQ